MQHWQQQLGLLLSARLLQPGQKATLRRQRQRKGRGGGCGLRALAGPGRVAGLCQAQDPCPGSSCPKPKQLPSHCMPTASALPKSWGAHCVQGSPPSPGAPSPAPALVGAPPAPESPCRPSLPGPWSCLARAFLLYLPAGPSPITVWAPRWPHCAHHPVSLPSPPPPPQSRGVFLKS